jgi:tetratricopeptide (TPR) repeat protein
MPWYWTVAVLWLMCGVSDVYAQDVRWESMTTAGVRAFEQGDYAEAARQFQAALAIAETLTPDDPRLSTSLINLATVYRTQGQYTQAESCYQRALVLQEQILGTEHPQLVEVLEAYAALKREMHPLRSMLPWSPASKMAARARRIREYEAHAELQEALGLWPIYEHEIFRPSE